MQVARGKDWEGTVKAWGRQEAGPEPHDCLGTAFGEPLGSVQHRPSGPGLILRPTPDSPPWTRTSLSWCHWGGFRTPSRKPGGPAGPCDLDVSVFSSSWATGAAPGAHLSQAGSQSQRSMADGWKLLSRCGQPQPPGLEEHTLARRWDRALAGQGPLVAALTQSQLWFLLKKLGEGTRVP